MNDQGFATTGTTPGGTPLSSRTFARQPEKRKARTYHRRLRVLALHLAEDSPELDYRAT